MMGKEYKATRPPTHTFNKKLTGHAFLLECSELTSLIFHLFTSMQNISPLLISSEKSKDVIRIRSLACINGAFRICVRIRSLTQHRKIQMGINHLGLYAQILSH